MTWLPDPSAGRAYDMSARRKTGTLGGAWVELERPRPPRVTDRYDYWTEAPPKRSERCAYWLRQIERGWLPNRRWRVEGYDGRADWLGIYIWEYQHVILPALAER